MILPKLTPEMVEEAVRRIVEAVHPLQIIAFGSRAKGTARPDSDLDLLVVTAADENSAESRRDERLQIRGALSDMMFSKDILVSNSDHMAEQQTWLGSVYRNAEAEGAMVWQGGITNPEIIQRLCH
jgi:predicted nucleotidyltransferase